MLIGATAFSYKAHSHKNHFIHLAAHSEDSVFHANSPGVIFLKNG
jgi:hypothetical protein